MTSVAFSNILPSKCGIEKVDLRRLTTGSTARTPKPASDVSITIKQYHPSLTPLLGDHSSYSLLLSSHDSSKSPFFHHLPAYLPKHDEIFLSSNLLPLTDGSRPAVILISLVRLQRNPQTGDVHSVTWQKLRPPDEIPMPASGAPYRGGTLFCSQGRGTPGTGGLFYMPRGLRPEPVVRSYFGRDFNSPSHVVVAGDGALWFTDPATGWDEEFRPPPQLPGLVYRFVRETGDLRVVADGLERPRGIAFSPDESTVYVCDGGREKEENEGGGRTAAVYAFDVVMRSGAPFLANRRVFAFALTGTPSGIVCDKLGNVYVGCQDGVEIFSPGGSILGVAEVSGGVSDLKFGGEGELFLCSEQMLFRLKLEGLAEFAAIPEFLET